MPLNLLANSMPILLRTPTSLSCYTWGAIENNNTSHSQPGSFVVEGTHGSSEPMRLHILN
eukprot:1003439-Pelagomonas_calceolata.AAC.1